MTFEQPPVDKENNNNQPRYEHDCENCTFLGIEKKYDLYYCGTENTLIARYGEEGDYTSMLVEYIKRLSDGNPLEIAYQKAMERNLIKSK